MKRITLSLAAIALCAMMTPSANAALKLRVYDGVGTGGPLLFEAIDNVLNDTDATLGQLKLAGGVIVGGLSIEGSFHTANALNSVGTTPLDTDINIGVLTSGSTTVTNNTGATISQTIQVTSSDFGPFDAPVSVETTAGGTWARAEGVSAVNSVDSSWYIDASNTEYGTATLVDTYLGTPQNPGNAVTSMSGHEGGPFGPYIAPGSPFSMTEQFVITLTAGTSLTSRGNNMSASAVPEPATLGAAMIGLLGAALVIRRRKSA